VLDARLRFRELASRDYTLDPIGTIFGILISATLLVVACYFIWRQGQTMRELAAQHATIPSEQRRFLRKQCWRRLFGAAMLVVLACMLFGSVFLDYDPLRLSPDNVPQVDHETARQAVGFLTFYLMTMLLILMAILTLAVLDFWAIARFGVQQQKQLAQEHQQLLEADLAAQKYRRSELN
jgi:hypothetical protein